MRNYPEMTETNPDERAYLQQEVRARIGDMAEQFKANCEIITDTVVVYWPLKEMRRLARELTADNSDPALKACKMVSVKCMEILEAKFVDEPPRVLIAEHLIDDVVVALANIWFENAKARAAFTRVHKRLRGDDKKPTN